MANNNLVKYEVNGQSIELSPVTVRQYLVSGGGAVTDQEIMMFIKLCEGQKLNPFTREAYLVKYGTQAASMVVGKDAFTRRAEANENYKGAKSGIIVINLNDQIENREGTFYLKDKEKLVGGWAKVKFKDNKEEVFNTVSLDEYIGRKRDGQISSMWSTKPATMIRKVALVQALREAFPNTLSQMYAAEEMEIDEDLPNDKIDLDEKRRNAASVKKPPKMANKAMKNQIMQLAHEKELMVGEGKDADISRLEELANESGMSLRALTEDQANELIQILMEYQVIQDIPEEDIQPVEEITETEIIEEETDSDEDPAF